MSINKKLFNLQQEIGKISKDSKNPFFNSKYFDINSLIEQVLPLLKQNKILLQQPVKDGKVWTILTCIDTGEFTDGNIELPEMNDPQKIGSAITYYRRYGLQSILAIQAEDDDANIASRGVQRQKMPLSQDGLKYIIEKGTKQDAMKALKERKVTREQETLIKKKHQL